MSVCDIIFGLLRPRMINIISHELKWNCVYYRSGENSYAKDFSIKLLLFNNSFNFIELESYKA